ncbi:hypothetical protein EOI86_10200 [Hwanghaeella grinnelliae]|uniref:Uncharacterized protein n=1 Tax=Hwanghaeella grinnelliae TaxID=2500179 RepID=A0A437QYJ7_9PROT|nr:hypothetical protein [Hwanghaeella grinnelliae]RVU39573.1 hypothetical protein EOI86_10200 [Hwanghaeella grinnelliae]
MAHARALERWRIRDEEKQRVKALSCAVKELDNNYGPIPEDTRRKIAKHPSLAGFWKGVFHGRKAELMTRTAHRGTELYGLIYFPDLNCALLMEFRPYPGPPRMPEKVDVYINKAALKTGFCSTKLGQHINADLSAGFFLSPESSKQMIKIVPSNASKLLSSEAGLDFSSSCDAVTFQPAPLSSAFRRLIDQEVAGWERSIPWWIPGKREWQSIQQGG